MDAAHVGADSALARLTRLEEKARAYANETWFREAWEQLATRVPRFDEVVERHAILMLKPDAAAARAIGDVVESARADGFLPVCARWLSLDRTMLRALWLYKFNIATVERMQITDLIHAQAPNLVVLVRDMRPEAGVPASVRLTAWKGPSALGRRRPEHLRGRLGIQNRLLSFVHTTDEPADLVRELGLFFPSAERLAAVEEAAAGYDAHAEVAAMAERLYETVPAQTLSLDLALSRIAAAADERAAAPSGDARAAWVEIARLCRSADLARAAGWSSLAFLLEPSALAALDPWDVITVGAHLVEQDLPGRTRTLGDADVATWRDA